ncbi:MAG: beta-glucosidase [Myxococcota bacterium]
MLRSKRALAALLPLLTAAVACDGDDPDLGPHLDPEVEARIDDLLSEMTLEEKVAQKHGSGIVPEDGLWLTPSNDRLGIPGYRMVDGPRGVSKATGPATTFPVAMARGATWNPELERSIGEAIGLECAARGGNVLLAPTINMLYHPRWGRAQETYGEDVHHLTRFGVAFIEGAQEHVIASAKHYLANSIEDTRFDVNVSMDERTLREIYLPAFRAAVQEARVGSVMTAYNQVLGAYAAENAETLGILKDEWGFHGFVESDWILGTYSTVASALAGLDIEMPSDQYFGDALVEAVRDGEVPEEVIDRSVRRILRGQLTAGLDDPPPPPSADVIESPDHRALAREAALQGTVLLKNEGGALPLDPEPEAPIAVAGALADFANLGDDGSSDVEPTEAVTPLAGLVDRIGASSVAHVGADDTLTAEDEAVVAAAPAAVVVVGLTAEDEGENIPGSGMGDRPGLGLSPEHVDLIRQVAEQNDRTVVVLEGGSAITVDPWVDEVPAVVMAWYPGMEGGTALAELLVGDANFSGKLPLTVPTSEDQLPPFDNESLEVTYGYFHGYRHLDREGAEPRFPFGHGLSYATFEYGSLSLEADLLGEDDVLRATFEVTNTGPVAGDEVAQLYVGHDGSAVERNVRELRAFERVSLEPGETATVTLEVPVRDLAYWDAGTQAWVVEAMDHVVEVGGSSRNLPLQAAFTVSP